MRSASRAASSSAMRAASAAAASSAISDSLANASAASRSASALASASLRAFSSASSRAARSATTLAAASASAVAIRSVRNFSAVAASVAAAAIAAAANAAGSTSGLMSFLIMGRTTAIKNNKKSTATTPLLANDAKASSLYQGTALGSTGGSKRVATTVTTSPRSSLKPTAPRTNWFKRSSSSCV